MFKIECGLFNKSVSVEVMSQIYFMQLTVNSNYTFSDSYLSRIEMNFAIEKKFQPSNYNVNKYKIKAQEGIEKT